MSKLAKSQKLTGFSLVEDDSNAIRMVVLISISLLSTFFLLFLEKTILPWPWLVEEIAKTLVIIWLILPLRGDRAKFLGLLIFALIFSLAENIFYFLNFINNNELSIYWQRFVWPLGMHLLTSAVILASVWKNKNWWFLGLILAMAIHWFYNNFWLSNF